MKELNYKINKIESELITLNQEKKEYLENIEKNKKAKKNMILYPVLPIVCGVVLFGIYVVTSKALPPIEFYNLMGISVFALECIFSQEELEQIINYSNTKKELKKTSLEEIEKKVEEKELEKTYLLEKEINLIENDKIISDDNCVFSTRDLYLDDTMHFLPETKEKVLVKKK